jgi:hypothetical protein
MNCINGSGSGALEKRWWGCWRSCAGNRVSTGWYWTGPLGTEAAG